jgi:signal peptidase I
VGERVASKKLVIAVALVLVVSIIGAVMFYAQFVSSQAPSGSGQLKVLIVTSASMEPTIMEGYKILVDTEVNPRDLSVDYPNSDIIVFYKTSERNELIVSRIVAVEEVDGELVFFTKDDANGVNKYPAVPSRPEYDPWTVTEDRFFGKVIDTDFG